MLNKILQVVRETIKKGISLFSSQKVLTANSYTYLSSVSSGAIIASVDDPFSGQGLGVTTFGPMGTSPGQLTVNTAGKILAGATVSVANSSYDIGIMATSGNGKKKLGSTLRFTAKPSSIILNTLALSTTNVTVGEISLSIVGATAGSIITATNLPSGLTISNVNRTITGTLSAGGTFAFSLIETLGNAVNSPKTSNVSLTATANESTLLPKIVPPAVNLGAFKGTGNADTGSMTHFVKFTQNPQKDGDWELQVCRKNSDTYASFTTNGSNIVGQAFAGGVRTYSIYPTWTYPNAGQVIEARFDQDTGAAAIYVDGVKAPNTDVYISAANFGTFVGYSMGSYSQRNYIDLTYGGVAVPLQVNTSVLELTDEQFRINFTANYVGSPTTYQTRITLADTVISDWQNVAEVTNTVAGKMSGKSVLVNRTLASAGGYLKVEIRQANLTSVNQTVFVDYPAPLKMMMNVSSGGGYYGGVYPFKDLARTAELRIGYGDAGNFFSTTNNPLQRDKNFVPHAWSPNDDHLRYLVMLQARPSIAGQYRITANMPFRTDELGNVNSMTPDGNGKYTATCFINAFSNLAAVTFKKSYGVEAIPAEGIQFSFIKVGQSETDSDSIWNPEYLEDYRTIAQGLRFMDIMGGNGAAQFEEKPLSSANRNVGLGSCKMYWSWETMVDMCNRTNCDAYLTMPYSADDDYIYDCVKHFRDNLKSGLKTYVEYSNEIWNIQFWQSTLAKLDGFARNLAGGQTIFPANSTWRNVQSHDVSKEYNVGDVVYTGYHLQRATQNVRSLYTNTVTHTSAGANAEHYDVIPAPSGAWQGVMKIVAGGVTYTDKDYYVTTRDGELRAYWGNLSGGNYNKTRNEPAAGASLAVHYTYVASVPDSNNTNPAWTREQDGTIAGQRYQALRSKQIFDLITPLFSARPNDLIRIIGGQAVGLPGQESRFFYGGVGLVTDRVALAPYFGDGVGGESATGYDSAEKPTWTKAMRDRAFSSDYYQREQFKTDLFNHMEVCRVASNRQYGAFKEELRLMAIKNNVPVTQQKVMSYEGQQHLFYDGKGWNGYNADGTRRYGTNIDGNFTRAMMGWWQDPRLADLMERYYDGIEAQVGNEFTYYQMTSSITAGSVQYGSWIANRYTGDRAAVRYMALRNKKMRLEKNTQPRPQFASQPTISPSVGPVGTTYTVSATPVNGTVFSTEWSIDGDVITGAESPTFVSTKEGVVTCQVGISGPGGSKSMISKRVATGNIQVTENMLAITTLSSTEKSPNITLASDQLTATRAGTSTTGHARIRATKKLETGKAYFEVKMLSNTVAPAVGDGTVSMSSTEYLGGDSHSFAYYPGPYTAYNDSPGFAGNSYPGAATFVAGDVIGIAVDATAKKIWISRNGTWAGDPVAGTGGITVTMTEFYPMLAFTPGSGGESCVCNFGDQDWAYPKPTGFGSF